MAIRPEIALNVRTPDVGQIFNNALVAAQGFQGLKERREQAPIQNRLLQAHAESTEAGAANQRSVNRVTDIAFGASEILPDLQTGNFAAVAQKLDSRRQRLVSEGKPTETTDEAISLLGSNPQGLLDNVQQIVSVAQQQGILQAPGGGLTSKQREFGGFTEGLSEEDIQRARRIELGLDPRAVSSAAITAATTPGLADKVIGFEGDKAGEIESARLSVRKTIKPQIEAAITKARLEAQNRGEILTDLSRAKAALPGLKEVTGKLRELAPLVSSTLGGRLFNAAVKETGFGATKGSTARAKFIAIVDNEVLPLLKATFGAAFTVQEGEALKATLGNPNASPEEKSAQIDAFIDSKMRQIETLEREASETQDRGAGEIMVDAQGNRARVFPDGSIEEL